MRLIPYSEKEASRWDQFVEKAAQGVFLHSRRYLAYHGDHFTDDSLLIENDKGQLRGIFPAAQALDVGTRVISHPGLTYGGLLHTTSCRAEEVLAMTEAMTGWYRERGYRTLLYKTVPHHVQRQVVQSDVYALWRAGGTLVRRDLWNVVDLSQPRALSKGHNWSYKKAMKACIGVEIVAVGDYPTFHSMLTTALMERHGTQPVHSLPEMLDLQHRFPEAIELWGCRTSEGELVAGVWLFKLHERCWHSQYITANELGRNLFATDLLLETMISRAQQTGISLFSFGSSTEDGGRHLNAGLFGFKAGFGVGAVVQDFYEVEL